MYQGRSQKGGGGDGCVCDTDTPAQILSFRQQIEPVWDAS